MNHVRPSTALAALALFLLFCPSSFAQSIDSKIKDFERGMRSSNYRNRIDAVRTIQSVEDVKAVDPALNALGSLTKDIVKFTKRIERDEKEIAEELHKRVEKPRMDAGKRQQARQLVEKQIAPLRDAVAKNRKALGQAEALRDNLGEYLRGLFEKLPEADVEIAAEKAVKHLESERQPANQLDAIRVLSYAKHDRVVAALAEVVALSRYPSLRVGALNSLQFHQTEAAGAAAAEALDDDYPQVRRAAILCLRENGGPESIPVLIQRMGKEEGHLQEEIAKTLKNITNASFGANSRRWADWWKKYGESYTGRGPGGRADNYDPDPEATKRREKREKDELSFYGIKSKAKNVIYILDVSGSMTAGKNGEGQDPKRPKEDTRLGQAVAELKKSIKNLSRKGTFNIIFYNQDVKVWRDKMQPASDKVKKAALDWADSTKAEGTTNIFDSLEKAFQMAGRGSFDKHYKVGVETIFLLSDGSPNAGKFTVPEEILREVQKLNELKKIQIHTISLGRGGPGGLMRQLAAQNNGQCVIVP